MITRPPEPSHGKPDQCGSDYLLFPMDRFWHDTSMKGWPLVVLLVLAFTLLILWLEPWDSTRQPLVFR